MRRVARSTSRAQGRRKKSVLMEGDRNLGKKGREGERGRRGSGDGTTAPGSKMRRVTLREEGRAERV